MAGGIGSTFGNDILKLIFNATAIANIADNAASSPLPNLYLSLHTADPGVGGAQTTSEAAYPGYARMPVARTSAGFTVSGLSATLTAPAFFAAATGGSETETYFGVGTAASGSGKILGRGSISPAIAVIAGTTPELTAATTVTIS